MCYCLLVVNLDLCCVRLSFFWHRKKLTLTQELVSACKQQAQKWDIGNPMLKLHTPTSIQSHVGISLTNTESGHFPLMLHQRSYNSTQTFQWMQRFTLCVKSVLFLFCWKTLFKISINIPAFYFSRVLIARSFGLKTSRCGHISRTKDKYTR